MEDIVSHPFLLSLKQTANQPDEHPGVRTLLEEQQTDFKEYVCKQYNSTNVPAPVRFKFLKIAKYLLNKIRKRFASQVKEQNAHFYEFWAWLIDDACDYINIGVDTLEFQARCPAHLLAEPVQAFPACIWTAQKVDLYEATLGIYIVDAVRLQDGSRPSFPLFAQAIFSVFGMDFDPKKAAQRVLDRIKSPTPFFERIIAVLKNKKYDKDDLKL
jgi:hypothetical protein